LIGPSTISSNELLLIAVTLASLIILLFAFSVFFLVGRHWIKAFMSGAPISVFAVIGMLLRGNPRGLLVDAYIQLNHRGSPATIADVELAYIANRHRVRTSHDLVSFVEERLAAQASETDSAAAR
jgi:uncharacterized protein YqfA (UPF0365 family)